MASQSSEKKYIYILKLRQGKWYIGSTTNLTQRLARHFEGTGSAWTSLFPPEELFDCQTQRDGWHEENLTKEYMCLFGIENVRGGPYTNVDFTEDEEEMIRRALDSFIGACYSCGSTSHIASRCPNGNRIDSPPRRNRTSQNLNENSDACFRCGRPGHYASECYATVDSNGNRLDWPYTNK